MKLKSYQKMIENYHGIQSLGEIKIKKKNKEHYVALYNMLADSVSVITEKNNKTYVMFLEISVGYTVYHIFRIK